MEPAELFARTPSNRFLGIELLHCSQERVELRQPVRAKFLQEEGVVQGGILTALADMAAVYLLWPFLPKDRALTGTSCAMHFLRAATLAGGELRAVATPLRIGRTLAVCESELFQGGHRIAKGTFTFLIREARTS